MTRPVLFHLCIISSLFVIPIAASAQYGNIALNRESIRSTFSVPERAIKYLNNIPIRSVRHFRENYPDVIDETWSLNRYGSHVRFDLKQVRYMIDYSKKGEWISTLRLLSEKQMPKDLRRRVKTTFFDFEIIAVSEFLYEKEDFYIVKITDQKTCQTLRVADDGIDVVEKFDY